MHHEGFTTMETKVGFIIVRKGTMFGINVYLGDATIYSE